MANPEHLEILAQGVEVWNEWREQNPGIRPDLKTSSLQNIELQGVNFQFVNLQRVNFQNTSLQNSSCRFANFKGANLQNSLLQDAFLMDANLQGATFQGANLQSANLWGANLQNADLQNANLLCARLRSANLQYANLQNTFLERADLENADLREANLQNADFPGACLQETNLRLALLQRAFFADANLQYADFQGAQLLEVIFRGASLQYANFQGATLQRADLKEANLQETNFEIVDLQGANLVASQAMFANFSSANLTGACIAQWGINEQTNFTDVQCDFIYLGWDREKSCPTDRRPHNPDEIFAPGDFARLMEQARDTVDLIFSDGIDWRAFLASFQTLQVSGEHGELTIQGINRKSDGSFVISVEAPQAIDQVTRAAIEQQFKTQYESELKILEAVYQEKLQAKEREIEIYRKQSTDITEIAKIMASRPIQVEANAMAESQSDKSVQQQFNSPTYGVAGNVEGNQVTHSGDNITMNPQSHGQSHQTNIAKMTGGTVSTHTVDPEIAATVDDIQTLLKQLASTSPASTTTEQMQLATQAIAQIESNPTWKQKAIRAAKVGTLEALKSNPVGAFVAGAIEGWAAG
ncbi:MAG: pentapeptide repeat-containing protein [Spirulinaceae cyanobacterium]